MTPERIKEILDHHRFEGVSRIYAEAAIKQALAEQKEEIAQMVDKRAKHHVRQWRTYQEQNNPEVAYAVERAAECEKVANKIRGMK